MILFVRNSARFILGFRDLLTGAYNTQASDALIDESSGLSLDFVSNTYAVKT